MRLYSNEARHALSQWFDLPNTTLAIEIAQSCNLRCPGCWVGISRQDLWPSGGNVMIDGSLLNAALSFGRDVNISKLSLLGGEPTLHPELPEIIDNAKSLGYKKISITTNGVASMARFNSILSSGLTGITFSVDGSTAEIHDSLRPSPNGKSTFLITLRNLDLAVANENRLGYTVQVNHTVYAKNLHDTENMIRLVHGKGVRKVRLHFSMPEDLPKPSNYYISPSDWIELYSKVNGLRDELGIDISQRIVYGNSWVSTSRELRSPYLVLQPSGKMLLCAAHARINDDSKKHFAVLNTDQSISLNHSSPAVAHHDGERLCCGAIPLLLEQMPVDLREMILEHGGMGCIILQSRVAAIND